MFKKKKKHRKEKPILTSRTLMLMENQFCKLFAHTGSAITWDNVGHP